MQIDWKAELLSRKSVDELLKYLLNSQSKPRNYVCIGYIDYTLHDTATVTATYVEIAEELSGRFRHLQEDNFKLRSVT